MDESHIKHLLKALSSSGDGEECEVCLSGSDNLSAVKVKLFLIPDK